MSRIPYADPGTLSPEARAVYDGARLGVVRVMANASDSLVPWIGVVAGIRNSPELDPLWRELSILRVLTTVDAPDEWVAHETAARAAGATDEVIEQVTSGTQLDGPVGLFVSLVDDIYQGRAPADERFAEVLEVASPRALVEAIFITGIYHTIGRLIEGIGPGAGPIPAGVD